MIIINPPADVRLIITMTGPNITPVIINVQVTAPNADFGAPGAKGYSPVLALKEDGERRVHQVIDWTGGEGVKPAVGGYIGVNGLVVDIADGADVRGAKGANGGGGGGGSVDWDDVENKPSTFPPSAHTHPISQINGLQDELDDKADAGAVSSALALKAPIANPTFTGTVSGVTKGMVGLGNVDNTSDASKPVSTAQQTALDLKANLASPTFTGTVGGITKSMVGLGNVDNTADSAKPVSTAQQTALDLKANLASPTFTGTVGGITKAMVGLGNVDNTSDTSKPVSTAQQTALDLKAPLASPTFTGTVSGITKAMVGLGNVDNTADNAKNVLSATKLATPRNINGTPFDGTSDITITAPAGIFRGIFDDFRGVLKCGILAQGTNTAVNTTSNTPPDGLSGVLTMNLGTANNGRVSYGGIGGNTAGNYTQSVLDSNQFIFEADVDFAVLSDSTNRFYFSAGFAQNTTNPSNPTSSNDGVFLEYSDNINSGQWNFRTRVSGSATSQASSITVAANTRYKLRLVGTSTSITAYVNGVSVGTITTNIPTGPGAFMIAAMNNAGTTAGRIIRAYSYLLYNP